MHGRDLLVQNLRKVTGNASTTKIWQDNWISPTEKLRPFGPVLEDASDLRVSDLLTTDLKWNKKKLHELLPDLADKIQCLRPSQEGVDDAFIWQPSTSGIYSTKSGYHSAMISVFNPTNARLPPGRSIDWYKDVWSGSCSPKLRVFLWSVLQKVLLTGENLHRRGINPEMRCPRCGDRETTMHMFALCPFAERVWSLIPLKNVVHLATLDSFVQLVVASRSFICLPPSGIATNVLTWVCWYLWTSRNQLMFEKKNRSLEEVATHSLRSCREWISAQPETGNHQLTNSRQQELGSGSYSPTTTISCNTDASWRKESLQAELGWIFSDPQSGFKHKGK